MWAVDELGGVAHDAPAEAVPGRMTWERPQVHGTGLSCEPRPCVPLDALSSGGASVSAGGHVPTQRDLLAAVAGNRFLVRRAVVELSRASALWALGLLELLLDVLVGDLARPALFGLEWLALVLVPHSWGEYRRQATFSLEPTLRR